MAQNAKVIMPLKCAYTPSAFHCCSWIMEPRNVGDQRAHLPGERSCSRIIGDVIMTAQRADASSSRDTMKPASSTQSSTSYLTLDTIWSHEKTNLLQGRYFDINRNQSLDQYDPPITPITLHYITLPRDIQCTTEGKAFQTTMVQ